MKWARDYRSDGFPVWPRDEPNVNSPSGRPKGRDGEGRSAEQTKRLLTSDGERLPNAAKRSARE